MYLLVRSLYGDTKDWIHFSLVPWLSSWVGLIVAFSKEYTCDNDYTLPIQELKSIRR